MKIFVIFIHAVVLWTLVECRNVGRLKRSLDVEGQGSNLTQKQPQGVIQSDVLQHFTSTPPPSEAITEHSTPSLVKDLPFLPEDINIQSLKNDDHLRVTYNRKILVDKETPDTDSQDQKKSLKTNTNDMIYFKYNKTGTSSSTSSEVSVSHSAYEHLSTSVVYDEDDSDEKTQDYTQSSTTEGSKVGTERKNLEVKKKEKGKKEILDSVTVSTDSVGAGKIEKPFKDSLLNSKLKDKKDSISEALDDRRSTTSRFSSSSSSSSVSLSDHDNNKLLNNMEVLKVNPPNTNNKEAVNQSVNSVINVNGVNNDSLKKPKIKTPSKRVIEDSIAEAYNNAVSSMNIAEESAKNMVSGVSHSITTPSPIYTSSSTEKYNNNKQYPPARRSQLSEAQPTKVDILPRVTVSSLTTVIKPSIAFKQQLANKLKALEPVPTAPMSPAEEFDESQGKIGGKPSNKFTLRKKPKLEHSPLTEMNIPPTATAWSLASLKSSVETLRSSSKPASAESTSSEAASQRFSTLAPVSRVKSFVPWSTRLLKSSSTKPPTTTSDEGEKMAATPDTETISLSQGKVANALSSPETSESPKAAPSSTVETQSVIRTTTELDRNHSETPVNIIQQLPEEVMVKDQSSSAPKGPITSEVIDLTTSTENSDPNSQQKTNKQSLDTNSSNERDSQVVENVIEAKQLLEENESQGKKEEKGLEKLEEGAPNNTNVIGNQIPQDVIGENVNEVKSNEESKSKERTNVNTVGNITTVPDLENTKLKSTSDHHDPGVGELVGEGQGEEGKSGEESEEEERQNHTTTLPPIFEPVETTTITDLDDDLEGESEREEEDFTLSINKTNQAPMVPLSKPNETNSLSSSLPGTPDTNGTGTYVTSIDIISKEKTDQFVTNKPSEGDINWYSVDMKPNNESVEETSENPIPAEVTTTVISETTIEPETSTKMTEKESTVLSQNTDIVTTMTPTTTVAVPSEPTTVNVESDVSVERDIDFDCVEDPSSCVRVMVHISPARLCQEQRLLREKIAAQISPHVTSWEQVVILRPQECALENLSDEKQDLSVNVCFSGIDQLPSPAIRNEFLRQFTTNTADINYPIINVQMIMESPMAPDGFDNVLAAIILSVIAAICLVLLGILLVIVRKRQGRFNYGQRCTPVSLDDYSMDNISVYNSVRRKGAMRASKRSYGNPGFDDPGAPSHPINFAGLANFSSDRDALDEEFNQIPMITVKPDELPPGAESKNRYANVIPLPETRVILHIKEGADPLNEYINANYVKGPKSQEKLYIACQAPLQSTIEDFWRMVWQQQAKVILMLTALNENGVEKCADYLPQLEITDCHRMFGDFQVTLKKHEVREKYIISSLQLKNLETNLWREVTHLWYVSWPAQGVPEDYSSMIAFLIEARSYMRGAQGPTVVHCSPGTGRTGTVVAIDLCIRDFETLRSVDIPKTVYALRRDRAGSVQTKDQYAFIYQVLNLYATKLTGGAMDSI